MIRRPPRSTQSRSSAASDVYKRQGIRVLWAPQADQRIQHKVGNKHPAAQALTHDEVRNLVSFRRKAIKCRKRIGVQGAVTADKGVCEQAGRFIVEASDKCLPQRRGLRRAGQIKNLADFLNALCLLYTSDAADDLLCGNLGGCRIIKKKQRAGHIREEKNQIVNTKLTEKTK